MASRETKKTTGTVLDDGTVIEMVYDRTNNRTSLIRFSNDSWVEEERIELPGLPELVPLSAENPLVEHDVVRFPSRPEPYESDEALMREVRSFIHRYVDVSDMFETIASAYVLFSWVYDAFNELPYLRVRGDYGTGKTRFLTIVGSIAYKPIFGSGASTVSPVFHLLEQFGGTLVMDEADLRFSDEKADFVKILNNGNVRGFPVLRAVGHKNGEFSPRAFHVYGPKIIASRGRYDDKALESRFLDEEMGNRSLRSDVPFNLRNEHALEAARLRNKLLMYRFCRRTSVSAEAGLVDHKIGPRGNQVLVPLLAIINDPGTRLAILKWARERDVQHRHEQADTMEAKMLIILRHLLSRTSTIGVAVGDVASLFRKHMQEQGMGLITDRRVGFIIRSKLGLHTQKSHGRFVLPVSDARRLDRLYERYGVEDEDVRAFEESIGADKSRQDIDAEDVGELGDVTVSGAE